MFDVVALFFFLSCFRVVSQHFFFDKVFISDNRKNHCCCYCPRIIWSYWENTSAMPADVEEIMEIRNITLANFTHVLATDENLGDFLNISSFPRFYSKISVQDRSVYVAFSVIEKFGGVYVDSTTYINSGSEMELFFLRGVKSRREMFGFTFGYRGHMITNFFGGCQFSRPVRRFKAELDKLLSKNFYDICKKWVCKRKHTNWGSCMVQDCMDKFYIDFVWRQHRSFGNKVANVKMNDHYQLAKECKYISSCVKYRLLNDPESRSYPFIKLGRGYRLGIKLNLRESKKKVKVKQLLKKKERLKRKKVKFG